MKRSGDSIHHFWSPTPTLNDCELTLLTGTQSSEQEYSYLTASNRHPSTPYSQNITLSFSSGTRPYTFPRSTTHVLCISLWQVPRLSWKICWRVEIYFFYSATTATKTTLGIIQLWFSYFWHRSIHSSWENMRRKNSFQGGGHSVNFPKFFQGGSKVLRPNFQVVANAHFPLPMNARVWQHWNSAPAITTFTYYQIAIR